MLRKQRQHHTCAHHATKRTHRMIWAAAAKEPSALDSRAPQCVLHAVQVLTSAAKEQQGHTLGEALALQDTEHKCLLGCLPPSVATTRAPSSASSHVTRASSPQECACQPPLKHSCCSRHLPLTCCRMLDELAMITCRRSFMDQSSRGPCAQQPSSSSKTP
jgi:hypothetical protein